jgi:hypothetical protein
MLHNPEDTRDCITAGIGLIVLIVLGFSMNEVVFNYSSEDKEIEDEVDLLLLNFLKTETGSGKIYDMIILGEGGDIIGLKAASKSILNFALNKDYVLKIQYPDQDKQVVAGSTKVDRSLGEIYKSVEGVKSEMKIPALNGKTILVELEVNYE